MHKHDVSRVFDRFPKLRVAFMEAGCSWAPYWFGRMNEEWKVWQIEAPNRTKKPSYYFKEGRIYSREGLRTVDRRHGNLFCRTRSSTTFRLSPLYISLPENIEHLTRREDLNVEAKKWLLAESAKKLYNLQ